MNTEKIITGRCETQGIKYSVILSCIDTGTGNYLKGTVKCDYVNHGGKCDRCSIRENYPEPFI